MKTITLLKDHCYDEHGNRDAYWYVLPSQNLRNIVIRQLLKRYPRFNYVLTWKDKYGWGVEVTHCDWVPPGTIWGW